MHDVQMHDDTVRDAGVDLQAIRGHGEVDGIRIAHEHDAVAPVGAQLGAPFVRRPAEDRRVEQAGADCVEAADRQVQAAGRPEGPPVRVRVVDRARARRHGHAAEVVDGEMHRAHPELGDGVRVVVRAFVARSAEVGREQRAARRRQATDEQVSPAGEVGLPGTGGREVARLGDPRDRRQAVPLVDAHRDVVGGAAQVGRPQELRRTRARRVEHGDEAVATAAELHLPPGADREVGGPRRADDDHARPGRIDVEVAGQLVARSADVGRPHELLGRGQSRVHAGDECVVAAGDARLVAARGDVGGEVGPPADVDAAELVGRHRHQELVAAETEVGAPVGLRGQRRGQGEQDAGGGGADEHRDLSAGAWITRVRRETAGRPAGEARIVARSP